MGHFDLINSASQVVTILFGIAAAVGYARKRAGKWVESIDEKFAAQAKNTGERFDAQATETEKIREEAAQTRTEVGEVQAKVVARLDAIETQLKPNGGGTHHDLMAAAAAAAVREAVREVDEERGRMHRRGRW